MNTNEKNQEIIDQAIAELERQTNLPMEKVVIETDQLYLPIDDDTAAAAILRVNLAEKPMEFHVRVKPTINDITVAQTVHTLKNQKTNWIIVTRHVHQKLAKTLRDLRIQFIDTTGNAFINVPPLFIQIQGNKRQHHMIEATEGGGLGKAGLKLVFALMCRPELLNATYRDIAKAARVALGTVAALMKDLTAKGYIMELANQQRTMVRQKHLLQKWVTEYGEKLRPGNVIGKYKATRPNVWKDENIQRFNAQWGGEVAAHRITGYIKPEITTIYARKPITNLVLDLKLRQDKQGDVEIRERFWDFENVEPDRTVVPPLLIYADMLATGDPRNIDTAQIIYDDYLQRHIRQD